MCGFREAVANYTLTAQDFLLHFLSLSQYETEILHLNTCVYETEIMLSLCMWWRKKEYIMTVIWGCLWGLINYQIYSEDMKTRPYAEVTKFTIIAQVWYDLYQCLSTTWPLCVFRCVCIYTCVHVYLCECGMHACMYVRVFVYLTRYWEAMHGLHSQPQVNNTITPTSNHILPPAICGCLLPDDPDYVAQHVAQ